MSAKRKYTLTTKVRNQLHTPKHAYDEQQKVKVFFKRGYSTMLLCKGLTELQAIGFEATIRNFCKTCNTKIEGQFIQTH